MQLSRSCCKGLLWLIVFVSFPRVQYNAEGSMPSLVLFLPSYSRVVSLIEAVFGVSFFLYSKFDVCVLSEF